MGRTAVYYSTKNSRSVGCSIITKLFLGPSERVGVGPRPKGKARVCKCTVTPLRCFDRTPYNTARSAGLSVCRSPYFPSYEVMGNSASSSGRVHHEDTVDFGHLSPQGVYSSTRDWKEDVVTQLIIDRKLAPFYRPLEEYDPSWDEEQILAARKEPPLPVEHETTGTRSDVTPPTVKFTHHKRPSVTKELPRNGEAAIYRDAAECPICFLVCSFASQKISNLSNHPLHSIILPILIVLVVAIR